MKLTEITLENWLAHRHLTMRVTPLTIVCGPNKKGKSSIADAVGFALHGELKRVDAKAERKELITEGAESGSVSLKFGGVLIKRDIESGKLVKAEKVPTQATKTDGMPFVLDISRLARMSIDDRRTSLLRMMGVEITPETIIAELKKRDRNFALLGSEFAINETIEAWCARAGTKMTECRGAWKQITGENYGSKKALEWTAQGPAEPTADDFAAAEDTVRQEKADEAVLLKQLGAIEAVESRLPAAPDSMRKLSLERQAELLDSAKDHLSQCETEEFHAKNRLDDADATLADVKGRQEHGSPEICPWCSNGLKRENGALECYSPPDDPATPEQLLHAQARRDELFREHRDAKVALERARAAVERAETAEKALTAIRADETAQGAPQAIETKQSRLAVEEQLKLTREALAAAETHLATLRTQREQAQAAAVQTKRAASMHAKIAAWADIQNDLSPAGIPQEKLAAALGPFNEQLAALALIFKWGQPRISDGMQVTVDGRRYSLCSESEQWRADVLLALTVAILTKLRMVVIDRFDVLELAARGPALGAFYSLTRKGMVDTIILMGTLKAPPSPIPPDVAVTWLGSPIEARAAA